VLCIDRNGVESVKRQWKKRRNLNEGDWNDRFMEFGRKGNI
jgi:hypothetical protein